jgi:hypothetical protein
LGERPFESDHSEASVTKRWGFIQEKCTNFNAAYDQVKKQKVSDLGRERLCVLSFGPIQGFQPIKIVQHGSLLNSNQRYPQVARSLCVMEQQ